MLACAFIVFKAPVCHQIHLVYVVDSVGDASNGSVVKSTSTEQVLLYIAMVNRELVDGIINFVTRNCGFGWINNSTTKEGLITK